MKLFEDFKRTDEDVVRRLEQDMQQTRPPSTYQGAAKETIQAIKDIAYVLFDGLGRLGHNIIKARISLRRSSSNTGSPTNTAVEAGRANVGPYHRRYVILCIDKGSTMTALYQERLGPISTDRQLVQFLKTKYHQYRSRRSWFTLRSLKSVSLNRVC